MLVGFTYKHTEELSLENLTTDQFLKIAVETSKSLGWVIGSLYRNGFIAYTDNGIFSWNAEIKLQMTNGIANFQSQSRYNQVNPLGKDQENLQAFISVFKEKKNKLSPAVGQIEFKKAELEFA